jgi:hypothetical protein
MDGHFFEYELLASKTDCSSQLPTRSDDTVSYARILLYPSSAATL